MSRGRHPIERTRRSAAQRPTPHWLRSGAACAPLGRLRIEVGRASAPSAPFDAAVPNLFEVPSHRGGSGPAGLGASSFGSAASSGAGSRSRALGRDPSRGRLLKVPGKTPISAPPCQSGSTRPHPSTSQDAEGKVPDMVLGNGHHVVAQKPLHHAFTWRGCTSCFETQLEMCSTGNSLTPENACGRHPEANLTLPESPQLPPPPELGNLR